MSVKGLFQSDPHDARILKAFALGLSVATRGMDHLRNRVTLEINARVNDDPAFKTALYGGVVSAKPNSYEGKEYAVRKCENTFAVGDSVGMCRFDTKLFNSPTLPDTGDFAEQVNALTGTRLDDAGHGRDRPQHHRHRAHAQLPPRPARQGRHPAAALVRGREHLRPVQGREDRPRPVRAVEGRFYALTGLNAEGVPQLDWHEKLAKVITGFAVRVELPNDVPGAPEHAIVVDEPVANVVELRQSLRRRLPEAAERLGDRNLNVAVNGEMVLSGEVRPQR
jgi:aldehyde:ferredoxin oxidoreductase